MKIAGRLQHAVARDQVRVVQRRWLNNPYIEQHQETEMSCFPSRPKPKVIYTGKTVFHSAYILQREPIIVPEVHPLVRDFEERITEEYKRYPRSFSGGNLTEITKKKFPDAYKSLSSGSVSYWNEPKFVQQELNVLRSLKVARRTTQYDMSDETQRQTLDRRLQERLFLIIEKNGIWQFPQAVRKQGECLRATADRAIYLHHRGGLEVHALSSSPQAHIENEDKSITFFFPTFYLTGMPNFPIQGSDSHAWVTRHELREYTFPSLAYKKTAYASCRDEWMPYDVPIFDN
ncbi:mL46 [Diplonema papillatum]|nr:mL46 [Diplonema papillatum]